MNQDEYASHDALSLAALVRSGRATPAELLDAALARQAEVDPAIHSIVIPMVDEARAAIRSGLPEGPFHGVPFLLKDLHVLYAGVRTTNGCRFFADDVPDHDSELVTRYKRAGLVIFGKTASPEFGLTTTTESLLFGQTHNPWSHAHSAGGSSGGAAAAVAAGILPAAHASDGGGSIRIPASCCGLFGLKPSRGRMPFGPDAGEGWSGMSTMHAVTRSVRDSAALLDATAGADLGAPYHAPPRARPYLDEVGAPPGRLRIALLRESFNGSPTHPDCVAAVDSAAGLCGELGHRVEEAVIRVDVPALGAASQSIMAGNLLATLEDRGQQLGRSFGRDDVESFTFIMTEAVRKRGASDYARAIRTIHTLGRQIERFLQDYDLILTPTMAVPPQKLGVLSLSNPDLETYIRSVTATVGYTQVFNASGHPAMSVPLHWSQEGLPIGVQFAARLGDEAALFRLAAQLESARPWAQRRPPR